MAAGQPRMYADQQRALGNNRPAQNVGQAFLGNAARVANTASGIAQETPTTFRALAAELSNNKQAAANAVTDLNAIQERTRKLDSGLFGAGTIYNSPTEKLNPAETAKRFAPAYVGAVGETFPLPATKAISGANLGVKAAKVGLASGVANAAADTGQQLMERGKVDLKRTATAFGAGTVLGAGAPILGAAARQVIPTSMPAVRSLNTAQAGGVKIPGKKVDAVDIASKAGAAERARAKAFTQTEIPAGARAKDFISENFTDDTAWAQRLDREIAKNKGVKVRNVPAEQRLDPQIQAFKNADTIMEQRYKDLGIKDFAKKLSNQKDYDAYTVYRRYNTNAERAAINKGKNETVAEAYARFSGGKDMLDDAKMAQGLDSTGSKYKDLFKEENAITQRILRERGNDPNLAISPAEVEGIIKQYPNYTPQYRSLEEDLLQFRRGAGSVGSMQGKNVKALGKGSTTRPIESPLDALTAYSDELVKKSQGNMVMSNLVENLPEKFRPLVTADQLIAKEQAKISLGELGVAGRAVQKELSQNRKATIAINRELGLLEKASSGKTTLKPTPNQITLKLAEMTDGQAERLAQSLDTKNSQAAQLVRDASMLRRQADDIKAAKAGVMSSGDLAAFEKAANKNTRRRVINGREEIYEVIDPRLAKNLDQMSKQEISQAARVLGVPTRFFKFFTTGPGSPAFVPIALTRDVFSGILIAKNPIRATLTPGPYIDALMAAAKKGEFFENITRKGVSGTMVEADRAGKKATGELLRNNAGGRAKIYAKSGGKALLRDIEDAGNFAERFTRARYASARYRNRLKAYQKDPTLDKASARDRALWDATEEYRESAINFGRGGKVTKEINSVAAYLNPSVQGGNKIRRSIQESPGAFIARASLATSLIAGAYAYNQSSPESKEVWDKIDPEDKAMNLIFVPKGAKFDRDTGKVTGVIKIPLPYEFRPFTEGIKQAFDGANDEDYGKLALSALQGLSGLSTNNAAAFVGQFIPSQTIRPVVENMTNYSFFTGKKLTPDYVTDSSNGDKSKEATGSSSGVSKAINRASGNAISPIVADNYIRSMFGGASKDVMSIADAALNKAGVISDKETTDSNPLRRVKERYTQSYGKSDAIKFFDSIADLSKGIKDVDDRKAFALLHEKDPNPGMLDSAEKTQIYLNRPAVLKADRELDKRNRKDGKAGNPLFDLSDDQLQKVLVYRSAKMLNDGKQTYDKNGNPLFTSLGLDDKWYDGFRDKETKFFTDINVAKAKKEGKSQAEIDKIAAGDYGGEGKTFSGAARPKLSDAQQAIADQYHTLPKGSGQRQGFLRANPWLLDYWDASAGFTNKERLAIGLKAVGDEDSSGGYGKKGGYSKGGGGSGGSSSSTYGTNNPYEYAIKLKAGGKAAKPTIKQPTKGKAKIAKKSVGKPKVTSKKSLV